MTPPIEPRRDEAALYKRLATLRTDVPPAEPLAELQWYGARPEFRDFCERQGYRDLVDRAGRWA